MIMTNSSETTSQNFIGFHYYQDTLHYSNQDLATWLPELIRLSASWVVLLSDAERAIPEQFITGLVDSGIDPIIQFKLPLPGAPTAAELSPILSSYARWGVKYVVFFDKPNDSSSWSSAGWSHQDLVERFIDRFLPLASEALRNELIPVFPPLMPGGSYWDTSFYKSSLQSLHRRGYQDLLNKMVAASYAYTFGHNLSWGEGGPRKWPQTRPYLTPQGSQDQRGFNNYAWMKSIAKEVGLDDLQVFLFGAGIQQPSSYYPPEDHAEIVESMLSKVGSITDNPILGLNFWLLAADPDSEEYAQAWVKSETEEMPAVSAITKEIRQIKSVKVEEKIDSPGIEPVQAPSPSPKVEDAVQSRPIAHYLLLPIYDWGVADWHLEVIRPFVRKYHPTVGFSIQEAALAKKVTVLGGDKDFSAEEISSLRNGGCVVDQISGDGTTIATKLLER